MFADLEMQNFSFTPPSACPSTNAKPCKSILFTVDESARVCRDYQEIKIQVRYPESRRVLRVHTRQYVLLKWLAAETSSSLLLSLQVLEGP